MTKAFLGGLYTGGLYSGGVYTWKEKHVTNFGGLYSGELIHGRGLFTEFYGILYQTNPIMKFGRSITGVNGKINKNLELVTCA